MDYLVRVKLHCYLRYLYSFLIFMGARSRFLITFCIGAVIVRGITVARRGDGPDAQIADPA
jgi:hypothetical protein